MNEKSLALELLVGNWPQLIDWTLLGLRLFIGGCFIVHGLGKLGFVGPSKGKPSREVLDGFADWLKSLGLPYPALQARLAMLSELVGGFLIAVGLFTRLGLVFCLVTMIVAAFIGHRGSGYLITNNPPGAEYTINLAAICAAMAVFGPGQYSVDFWLFG